MPAFLPLTLVAICSLGCVRMRVHSHLTACVPLMSSPPLPSAVGALPAAPSLWQEAAVLRYFSASLQEVCAEVKAPPKVQVRGVHMDHI